MVVIGSLPPFVQTWLDYTADEPNAATFTREANRWESGAVQACAVYNWELAYLCRVRAAAMRTAARLADADLAYAGRTNSARPSGQIGLTIAGMATRNGQGDAEASA